MKRLYKLLFVLCVATFHAAATHAQCLEYRTGNNSPEIYTKWYSSKQDACTASAADYSARINAGIKCPRKLVRYVGTAVGSVCKRPGTVYYCDGQVGGASPQDVGWFEQRSCQYKPEETACPVGNPTLPGLGTKIHTEAIYKAVFAAPISFELSYRSAYSGRSMLPNGTWLHSFSNRLYIDASLDDVHALAGDGSVVHFVPGANANTWTSAETFDTLSRIPAATPSAVTWVLQRRQTDIWETYDHTGRLLKTTERNGWTTTLSYSTIGQLQSVSNAFGRQLVFNFDSNGYLTTLTAPGGAITRFNRDAQGRLLAITWPSGEVKRYHYEDTRFPQALTGITDETGQRIGTYTYDAQGRVAQTQRAGGVDRMQFSYGTDAAGAPKTQVTDFNAGASTTRTYNFLPQGRMLRPAGVSSPCPQCNATAQSIQYNASGLTVSSTRITTDNTGAAGFSAIPTGPISTTQYTYNADHLNTSITKLSDGVQTQRWNLAYNAMGDLISIVDVTGGNQSATLTNDLQGRLTHISASNGAAASYGWNLHGQMATATLPGFTATLAYDARRLLTEVGLSTGQWLRVSYNASGEPVSVLDSTGQVQQVSGLSTHWLRSADPIGAAQTLLIHSLQKGKQRVGDALVPSAFAQPIPLPIPPGIAGGLAASGGGSLANRADQGPTSNGCCGSAGSISTRDMQERLQRTLPFNAGRRDRVRSDVGQQSRVRAISHGTRGSGRAQDSSLQCIHPCSA